MVRLRRDTVIDFVYALFALLLGEEFITGEHALQQKRNRPIQGLVWRFCDVLFRITSRIKPLQSDESHLFTVAHHRYLGAPFTVDGIGVRRFDPVIGIHINNRALTNVIREEGSMVSLAARLIKEANRSFPALSNEILAPKYRKAKILCSITFLHRGVERFGFTTYPIKNRPVHLFFSWYLRNSIRMADPDVRSLSRSRHFCPRMIAISKHRLIEAYGGSHNSGLSTDATVEASSH